MRDGLSLPPGPVLDGRHTIRQMRREDRIALPTNTRRVALIRSARSAEAAGNPPLPPVLPVVIAAVVFVILLVVFRS